MAKARMLHKTISVSLQVNKLPLPAILLFTWLLPHADDEGRLKGDPRYIKGTVVPLFNWSAKKVEKYLNLIKNQGLINYWEENNERFIEFPKWKNFQQIKNDRKQESLLPSFNSKNVSNLDTSRIQKVSTQETQSNTNEINESEIEERLIQANISDEESVADIDFGNETIRIINPKTFEPKTDNELAALEAWQKLESNNPLAFKTYLRAGQKGLPVNLFYEFTSEIMQDPTIKNRGAVFNTKVKEYFNDR